ncbi:MAG TPA: DUF3500 domain-containing protein [Vicinamibacterales bacterium]|jgi:hypothetical protein|nr:DUF3500 domain-containing protein [Vicinamibacterales bacterium]
MKRLWLTIGVAAALAVGSTIAAERSASSMATAATRFVDSLSPGQRQQATFAFDGDERLHWHFIPTETFPRKGLTIKEMSEAQRTLAHELLKTGLSQRGYMTATQIMDLEDVLGALEAAERAAAPQPPRGRPLVRDTERYFFSVFGTPSAQAHAAPWGWRVEGHHVSLHFTVVDGAIAAGAPTFFGSNPAEVRDGPKKGLRILGAEEDAARAFMNTLDAAQREKTIISADAPGDMITMANVTIDPLSPTGISAAALNASQRALLMRVVDIYTGYMASGIAADRVARYKKAGEEKIAFAWAGPLERGKKHYYRIQGPTFLVEYDNTQNDANHIHSVWRDFNGDFGRDLLRDHLRSVAH